MVPLRPRLPFTLVWGVLCLVGSGWAQDKAGGVAPVGFSLPDQTFTEPLTLELSCETEGAFIYYSTDGHPLTLFNRKRYTEPLVLSESSWIRAQAQTPDGEGPVRSGHYIRIDEEVGAFRSPLPLLILENFGQGALPSKQWNQSGAGVRQVVRQRCQWFLFEPKGEEPNRLRPAPDASARLGVRVRGAFSSSFPRKPFSVEAWDEADAPVDMAPLGLPAESDWILYAPNAAHDQTLLFNTWLYAMSRSLGGNAVRFRFTEAFVHTDGGTLSMDDYAGVYVLMEKVKRGGSRLDFPRMSEDGSEGGWLLSINRMDPIPEDGFPAPNGVTQPQYFHTAGPNRRSETAPNQPGRGDDIPRQHNAFINFESPNGYRITAAQRASIEGWFEAFENVLYSDAFRDPVRGYRAYLDVDSFVDYFALHDLTANTDGLLISMWVYKEGPEEKLKMGPVWDYDLAYRGEPTSNLGMNRNRLWYGRLWQDPDFSQRYVDRWQAWRDGPLANEAIEALIEQQASEITEAVARNHGIPNWRERLDRWKRWIEDRAMAIDDQFEPRPRANPPGGRIAAEATVTLKAGTIFAPRDIFFTLDGSDPREMGGGLAAAATRYTAPLTLESPVRLRARVRHEGEWSGLLDHWVFPGVAPASAERVRISKIHYHPSNPSAGEVAAGFTNDDDFEFLEILNIGDEAVHLGGARFDDGIGFEFAETDARAWLDPGERRVVVGNREAFEWRYGKAFVVAGEYTGRLSNSGERVRLVDFQGTVIEEVAYDDRQPWPEAADGGGPSLVRMIGPARASGPFAWRRSVSEMGAPGVEEVETFLGDPLADLDGNGWRDGVEFASGSSRDISESPLGWIEGTEGVVLWFARNLLAKGVSVQVEHSSDLVNWITLPPSAQIDRVDVDGPTVKEFWDLGEVAGAAFVRLKWSFVMEAEQP